MTGFPSSVAAVLRERAGGLCEGCGRRPDLHSHHRRPRAAGGVSGGRALITNSVANGLRLCLVCHDLTESDPLLCRDQYGWLVPQHADPHVVPAWLVTRFGRGWFLLPESGAYLLVDAPALPLVS